MNDLVKRLSFRPLFAAMACAFAASAAPAATLTATGSYQLDGASVVPLLSGPSGGSVDVLAFPYGTASSAGLHSYGSPSGNFGSRSSGYGVYDVNGSFRIVETISNNTGAAAQVDFNFHITPGLLQNEVYAPLTGSQYVSAGLNFNVQRNGSSVWGSSATLSTDANGTVFNSSGTNLYAGSGTYYAINGVNQTVDLGVLDAGQSLTLQYDLTTFARGNAPAGNAVVVPEQTFVVPDQWVDFCHFGNAGVTANAVLACGYGGYGDFGGQTLVPGTTVTIPAHTVPGTPGGSHASSGDPFNIGLNNNGPSFSGRAALPPGAAGFNVTFSPAAVPEPTTGALLLSGLAAVALVARRRRAS